MDSIGIKNKFGAHIKGYFKILENILLPRPNVLGIEFKDAAIRMALLKNGLPAQAGLPPARAGVAQAGDFKKVAVMLEPGIIDGGKIKDKVKLLSAIKDLRNQFGLANEVVPVIAIIPSVNVYTKVFSIPSLDQAGLEEAAILNLKSISPIGVDGGYADWQKIGIEEKGGKVDILGAFAQKESVDEYMGILEASGFRTVAVEFPSLAITRTIKELASDVDLTKPQVVINVASDGIDFMILSYGDLYFDYFVPWKLIQEEGRISREILFEDFKDTIVREVKKMANFYGSHWGGKIENFILITQALNAEISELIKTNFQYQVNDLHLSQYNDVKASWFAVLGSALRGRMPRRKDVFISLTSVGTEELSLQAETRFFFKTWRNILIASLGFLALTFLLVDSFLAHTLTDFKNQASKLIQAPAGAEVIQFQSQAQSFNQLVDKIFVAKSQSLPISPSFSKIYELLNSRLSITRMTFDAGASSVMIVGEANNESTAVDFKNSIVKAGFRDVSLPLSNLQSKATGGVSFTITFKVNP